MASPSLSALSAYRQIIRATRVAFRGTSQIEDSEPKQSVCTYKMFLFSTSCI
jgi:hypothetical protein